jgi:hypothetical protein
MTGCGVNGVEPSVTTLVLRRLYKRGGFQINFAGNTVVKASGSCLDQLLRPCSENTTQARDRTGQDTLMVTYTLKSV